MHLFRGDTRIFSKKRLKLIFFPWKLKKRASKVAHIPPNPFFHSPKLIFHIINMSQDSSVSLSVPSAKTCRVVTMIQITGLQSKAISSVRQRRLETSLQLDCFPLSLTNSAHFVTLSTVPGLSLPTESQLILWHFLQSRGYLYWLKVDQFYSRLLTWPRFLSFSFFFSKVDLLPHHHQLWCCLLGWSK